MCENQLKPFAPVQDTTAAPTILIRSTCVFNRSAEYDQKKKIISYSCENRRSYLVSGAATRPFLRGYDTVTDCASTVSFNYYFHIVSLRTVKHDELLLRAVVTARYCRVGRSRICSRNPFRVKPVKREQYPLPIVRSLNNTLCHYARKRYGDEIMPYRTNVTDAVLATNTRRYVV